MVRGVDPALFQTICARAVTATGALAVRMTHYNPDTRQATALQLATHPTVTLADTADLIRRHVPDWVPGALAHRVERDIHRRIYEDGVVVQVGFRELAEGTQDPRLVDVAADYLGFRHALAVPLRISGQVVGALVVTSAEALPPERRLAAEAFASQAELTLENARLSSEIERIELAAAGEGYTAKGWERCRETLDQASKAVGVRWVVMTRFDPATGHVHTVAVTHLPSMQFVHCVLRGFDPLRIGFPADVNPVNQAAYLEGRTVEAPFAEAVRGIINRRLLDLAVRFESAFWLLVCPVLVGGRVAGALAYPSAEPLGAERRLLAEQYAAEIGAVLESGEPTAREACARGPGTSPPSADGPLRYADVVVDPRLREAFRGGSLLPLTPREYGLLEFLLRYPEQALSRDELARHVWGYPETQKSNFVDMTVMRLRRKLEANGRARLVQAAPGYGYLLRRDDGEGGGDPPPSQRTATASRRAVHRG